MEVISCNRQEFLEVWRARASPPRCSSRAPRQCEQVADMLRIASAFCLLIGMTVIMNILLQAEAMDEGSNLLTNNKKPCAYFKLFPLPEIETTSNKTSTEVEATSNKTNLDGGEGNSTASANDTTTPDATNRMETPAGDTNSTDTKSANSTKEHGNPIH